MQPARMKRAEEKLTGEGNHEFLCVHRRVTRKQRKELFDEAGIGPEFRDMQLASLTGQTQRPTERERERRS